MLAGQRDQFVCAAVACCIHKHRLNWKPRCFRGILDCEGTAGKSDAAHWSTADSAPVRQERPFFFIGERRLSGSLAVFRPRGFSLTARSGWSKIKPEDPVGPAEKICRRRNLCIYRYNAKSAVRSAKKLFPHRIKEDKAYAAQGRARAQRPI